MVRAARLLKLAAFLETVPRRAFDIHQWQKSPPTKSEGGEPGECGFAGCAMGWAANQRMFRGLKIVRGEFHAVVVLQEKPRGRKYFEFDAGSKLFEIDGDSSRHLFSPMRYERRSAYFSPTPKQVARRIRSFVKEHAK